MAVTKKSLAGKKATKATGAKSSSKATTKAVEPSKIQTAVRARF